MLLPDLVKSTRISIPHIQQLHHRGSYTKGPPKVHYRVNLPTPGPCLWSRTIQVVRVILHSTALHSTLANSPPRTTTAIHVVSTSSPRPSCTEFRVSTKLILKHSIIDSLMTSCLHIILYDCETWKTINRYRSSHTMEHSTRWH